MDASSSVKTEPCEVTDELTATWTAYVEAARKAQAEGAVIADAIAAGHAWRRWLELFARPDNA